LREECARRNPDGIFFSSPIFSWAQQRSSQQIHRNLNAAIVFPFANALDCDVPVLHNTVDVCI
jgi:hypothetical protein